MKTEIFCIVCEFFTVAGMLYAIVSGARLEEILAGALVMLLVSLLIVRTEKRKSK